MKMTPLNVGVFALAVIAGAVVGLQFPIVGLVLLIPAILFVVIILVRNKLGALAGTEETARALAMAVPPGKALLYVMRKGFFGGQQGMNITIDGTLDSQIRTNHFLTTALDPGQHSVKARMASGTKSAARTHELSLSAGDIVLLDMKLTMGLIQGAPDFTEVRDAVQARQMLNGCRLVLWKDAAA